jgi:adenine-specific DNA methylase
MIKMFKALLPYYGGKRKLCPVIFRHIAKYLPRQEWPKSVFVDAFLGSGAVSLFAKAQGFRIIANDIAERSFIAGKALIENNQTFLTDDDLRRLCVTNGNGIGIIEKNFVPDVFTRKHAAFLDNAFVNARKPLDKYVLLKYIFAVRPYSKFSSPNAFNRPMEEGRFDEIKHTYTKHIKDNLKPPLAILKAEKATVNKGIVSNGHENRIFKKDVFDFVGEAEGDVLYLDPPYAGTLAYEREYEVLDKILGEEKKQKSPFSNDGMEALDALLSRCQRFPLWVISFGNAGGKNYLENLVGIVSKYRKCEAKEFSYQHCGAVASEEHKQKSKEWLILGHNAEYHAN